jgi:membrane-associated progesterone receptor component
MAMRKGRKSEHEKRKGEKEEEGEAKKVPSHYGNLTKDQLKAYTGKDESKPLLVGINGKIYDVTSGSEFYGPGGPYNLFTGIDASRALGKMSFKPEDLAGGTEDLSQSEKDILFDWEQKFKSKYKYVGDIVESDAKL